MFTKTIALESGQRLIRPTRPSLHDRVSGRYSVCHRGFITDPARWTASPRRARIDIGGVVPVVLAPLAQAGRSGGGGNVHAGHAGVEPTDKPLAESSGFGIQVAELWLYAYPLPNTLDAFGMAG